MSQKLRDKDIENQLYSSNESGSECSDIESDKNSNYNAIQKEKRYKKRAITKRKSSNDGSSLSKQLKTKENIAKDSADQPTTSNRSTEVRSSRKRRAQMNDCEVKPPKQACNTANKPSVLESKSLSISSKKKTGIAEKLSSPKNKNKNVHNNFPINVHTNETDSPKKISARKVLFSTENSSEITNNIHELPSKESSRIKEKKIMEDKQIDSPSKCNSYNNRSTPQKITKSAVKHMICSEIEPLKILIRSPQNSRHKTNFTDESDTENNSAKSLNNASPFKQNKTSSGVSSPLKIKSTSKLSTVKATNGTPLKNTNVLNRTPQKDNKHSPSKFIVEDCMDNLELKGTSKLCSLEELKDTPSKRSNLLNRTPQKNKINSPSIFKLKECTVNLGLLNESSPTPQMRTRSLNSSKTSSAQSTNSVKRNAVNLNSNTTPLKDPRLFQIDEEIIGNTNIENEVYTPNKTCNEISTEPKNTPYSSSKCSDHKLHALSSPFQKKEMTVRTPISKKNIGRGFLTPSMAKREHEMHGRGEDDALYITRKQLHISTIPTSLPCRETEFNQIKSFLLRKIEHSVGGCMYISGVPGTGKTATVHAVIRSLYKEVDEQELPDFDFVEVNGLRLTEPKQAYVRIYQALEDRKVTPDQAQQMLNKKFSGTCKKSTIILVDELDYLCNRRQDVVYNILDWPSKRGSGLVVLTISNTMDLPERTLKGRVTSRMGLTRLMFQPYSHHQLKEIVHDRLSGTTTFHPDAVQLVARKVAAVSGDARRALDICRRTMELVPSGQQVTATHVEQALTQIFSGPRIVVIQRLSSLSQMVLRSLRDVNQRTGVDEATVSQVYRHLEQLCILEGCMLPTVGIVLQACVTLVGLGLAVAERGRMDLIRKISLNVSSDDIHYALDNLKT